MFGLWGRNADLIEEMKARRANAVYLPDIVLPRGVVPTASLEEALQRADIVLAALPSHGTRDVIRAAAPFIPRQALIVSATKGIEQDTLLRVSEVIAQEVRGARPVAVLSGPSFAIEVARGLPTAVSVACADPVLAEDVQREFRAAYFRLYGSTDVVGVEIGGALKNIIAIAAGVVEGLGLGQNALAALITRGLAEITRLACAVGGRRETLAGLSGLGDLVLDLHRFAQPQSARRRRAGARPADFRSRRRHEDGGRRGEDDHGRAGARPKTWRRAADCDADG